MDKTHSGSECSLNLNENKNNNNNKNNNKHNAELQLADPSTKDMGYFSTMGLIFPHDVQNGPVLH